jgi:hypothetical protein
MFCRGLPAKEHLSQDLVPRPCLKSLWVPITEGTRIHRWWKPTNTLMAMGKPVTAVGKPPVPFRKVVTTELPDGRQVTVNAQQYVVLAYDVPPPPKDIQ